MAGCNDTVCSCVLRAGAGITVTGSGTPSDPYRITSTTTLENALIVNDTDTVDLVLSGSGNQADPFVLTANASIRVEELSDVVDPAGPEAGDTLVFSGGQWSFAPPPPSPPGSVNVGVGLAGTGALATPLRVRLVSDTAGPTSGLAVYVDTAGNLRATPPAVTTVTWAAITDKPTTFPTTPESFTGTLPVNKGGTGQTSLANVTVGSANTIGGRRIFVQSGTPSGVLNDLWFF